MLQCACKTKESAFHVLWKSNRGSGRERGKERSFHLFIMTDFFWVVFLSDTHAQPWAYRWLARSDCKYSTLTDSDQFACMKSAVFLNRVDEPAELWLQGPVVSITDTFQMQKKTLACSIPAFRWASPWHSNANEGLKLLLLQRSGPQCQRCFQARTSLICFALILSRYVFLISKRPWRSTNKPQR